MFSLIIRSPIYRDKSLFLYMCTGESMSFRVMKYSLDDLRAVKELHSFDESEMLFEEKEAEEEFMKECSIKIANSIVADVRKKIN